ncbi:MAG: ATP-dependent metalloprotease FtsH [Chloroflexi bacterium OLB15]|nr:MAG: ATP-dependent metalloprotease FtsH [Chloroflexi bacterium OLB15]
MFPPNNSTPPSSGDQNNNQPNGDGTPPRSPFSGIPRWSWLILVGVLLLWSIFRVPDMVGSLSQNAPIDVPYSFFYDQVASGNVSEVVLQSQSATGTFRSVTTFPPDGSDLVNQGVQQQSSTAFTTTLLPIEDPALTTALRENNVTVIAQTVETNQLLLFLLNWGPLLLIFGLIIWQTRRAQRQMGGVFGFGRTQAREYNTERPQIKFADVAGQETAKGELAEIVDFLKEPEKYIALGARIPRGVLLVGPPGTGKTLLARAVAGEANVAFFSISASEFVEMFVGVGASRVRDLFAKAKAAAPSIVFIDEIDAVGRQRGAGLGGGNDEREQTLNQMLSEMDGFDQNESVIVMAATNRPDVLDPALLRPGRFDRQVTVALPDRAGREDTLKVHTRGKPLADEVSLVELSKATIGFSGADLANLANEAALTAARHNRKRIVMSDFLEAFDRIVLGNQSPPLSNPQERRVVAYHEAGHAMVAALTPHADPVLKVTIVPRGQALGVTAMMPDDERRNYPRNYLLAQMMVMLGGRAAEEVMLDDITTGASDDLRRVTGMARRMVSQFGMSDVIGPLNFGEDERQPFLGYSLSQGRSYSEETASQIDSEVRRIVDDLYERTKTLLDQNRDKLEALTQELLTNEVVTRARVMAIAGEEANKAALPTDIFEGAEA